MQEGADSVSDCSSISRATDADWEDLAMADRPQSMMGNASMSFNMLVQCATSQIEHIRKSEVYQVYLKDNPTLSACGAVVLGILSLPALTFLSFIIVLCLLTFMGFLFIEASLLWLLLSGVRGRTVCMHDRSESEERPSWKLIFRLTTSNVHNAL